MMYTDDNRSYSIKQNSSGTMKSIGERLLTRNQPCALISGPNKLNTNL